MVCGRRAAAAETVVGGAARECLCTTAGSGSRLAGSDSLQGRAAAAVAGGRCAEKQSGIVGRRMRRMNWVGRRCGRRIKIMAGASVGGAREAEKQSRMQEGPIAPY